MPKVAETPGAFTLCAPVSLPSSGSFVRVDDEGISRHRSASTHPSSPHHIRNGRHDYQGLLALPSVQDRAA
ncbi:hypothetical protein VUR80DRAFT_3956 [Thermomyces stellatus]